MINVNVLRFSILFSFFIIFSNFYIIYFNLYEKSFCISLVIPSTNVTWNNCRYQIENMICKSIEIPEETIIIISESIHNKRIVYNTYCKYKMVLLYRNKKRNSASNKNYGSKHTKCSYISYFDGDDIMSNKRISILHNVIKKYYKYDLILHMYTKNYNNLINSTINKNSFINHIYSNSTFLTKSYRQIIKLRNIKLWGCCTFLPGIYHISNGWITVKNSLFKSEIFNEDKSLQRAEDSEYNGRVISKGYKALIIKLTLGFYSKQNECNLHFRDDKTYSNKM